MEIKLEDEVILISKQGKIIRLKANSIPRYGRATQGVRMINLAKGDHLVGVSRIHSDSDDEPDSIPENNDSDE
ncbi:hypothetical protein MJH12_10040 [bacterium]|nr:hypothetical protein [bacterium]